MTESDSESDIDPTTRSIYCQVTDLSLVNAITKYKIEPSAADSDSLSYQSKHKTSHHRNGGRFMK